MDGVDTARGALLIVSVFAIIVNLLCLLAYYYWNEAKWIIIVDLMISWLCSLVIKDAVAVISAGDRFGDE